MRKNDTFVTNIYMRKLWGHFCIRQKAVNFCYPPGESDETSEMGEFIKKNESSDTGEIGKTGKSGETGVTGESAESDKTGEMGE